MLFVYACREGCSAVYAPRVCTSMLFIIGKGLMECIKKIVYGSYLCSRENTSCLIFSGEFGTVRKGVLKRGSSGRNIGVAIKKLKGLVQ